MNPRTQMLRSRSRKKRKILSLSGSALKWIGLVLTCIGTFGMAVLQRGMLHLDGFTNETLYAALLPGSEMFGTVSAAVCCTLLSALALPIYAKLVYEGWKHTASVKRYLLRLLACALVSEIPYDLAYRGAWFDISAQNPVWGMALAVLVLEIMERYGDRPGAQGAVLKIVFVVAGVVWATLLQSQLGIMFVALAALYYCFEGSMVATMLGGIALTLLQFPAPFGMLAVYWYDERPGRAPRWLFYVIYPVQLLVFALIGMALAR